MSVELRSQHRWDLVRGLRCARPWTSRFQRLQCPAPAAGANAGQKRSDFLSHAPATVIVVACGLLRRYAPITRCQEATRKYDQYECGDEAFHSFQFGFMDLKRINADNIERYGAYRGFYNRFFKRQGLKDKQKIPHGNEGLVIMVKNRPKSLIISCNPCYSHNSGIYSRCRSGS
jgi:hypothetical protein